MDEERKRRTLTGVVIGAAVVGLIVLARRTPREQWGDLAVRLAKDGLKIVRSQYGDSEPLRLVETQLDKFSTASV